MENVNFGKAVEALNEGKRITRKGWADKGLFVFKQIPSVIGEGIVPNMQSLPQSVKDEFIRRFECKYASTSDKSYTGSIRYDNQLALVYPDNLIVGWSPSVTDALAVDWLILD
jgi:hypothetical protein